MSTTSTTLSPSIDRTAVEDTLSRELRIDAEAAIKVKRFIRKQIAKHPTLSTAHGNSRSKKHVLEVILFPALSAEFPHIFGETRDEEVGNWHKTIRKLLSSQKHNLSRLKKRTYDEEFILHNRRQCTPIDLKDDGSDDSSIKQCSPQQERQAVPNSLQPFERMIVAVTEKASKREFFCQVQFLAPDKRSSLDKPLEASDLEWKKLQMWLNDSFGLGISERCSLHNHKDGCIVSNQTSFRALSAEQYWKGYERLRFDLIGDEKD